jgi:hypothetical protein
MATPTLSALTALLDRQRQALARLQEDIAAIERTIAVLKGRPAAPAAPRAPVTSGSRPPLRAVVLDILKASPTPLSPAALRAQLAARGQRCHRSSLTARLASLRQQGLIRRTAPGLYQAVSAAAPAPPASAARPAVGASRPAARAPGPSTVPRAPQPSAPRPQPRRAARKRRR